MLVHLPIPGNIFEKDDIDEIIVREKEKYLIAIQQRMTPIRDYEFFSNILKLKKDD